MSENVTFTIAGVVLAGSLTLPDRGAPVPGVVMVGGAGPSDRDNGTHFPAIRRHLVDAGIAVLSYDKRGVGGSSGDWLDATMDDLASDAAAALDFLPRPPGDADRRGVPRRRPPRPDRRRHPPGARLPRRPDPVDHRPDRRPRRLNPSV
ncbi:alpha/beta hydrolase family protein [Saccharothrix deserti]|uniref:alpha/beta hydrolase family protein n=1 Tax=Saccharothrix deserti TaxID=2593674 RepID=UPI00131D9CD4|nr:CocE/NonD family hydrolase [Saccharothrix deserti]